jgi:hypothetical protein
MTFDHTTSSHEVNLQDATRVRWVALNMTVHRRLALASSCCIEGVPHSSSEAGHLIELPFQEPLHIPCVPGYEAIYLSIC